MWSLGSTLVVGATARPLAVNSRSPGASATNSMSRVEPIITLTASRNRPRAASSRLPSPFPRTRSREGGSMPVHRAIAEAHALALADDQRIGPRPHVAVEREPEVPGAMARACSKMQKSRSTARERADATTYVAAQVIGPIPLGRRFLHPGASRRREAPRVDSRPRVVSPPSVWGDRHARRLSWQQGRVPHPRGPWLSRLRRRGRPFAVVAVHCAGGTCSTPQRQPSRALRGALRSGGLAPGSCVDGVPKDAPAAPKRRGPPRTLDVGALRRTRSRRGGTGP